MLEGMHLTEMTRACAASTAQFATNATHPGCVRALCRIALAILLNYEETGVICFLNPLHVPRANNLVNSVLRKPFVSLARMVIWSETYARGDIDPQDPTFRTNGEAKLELEAARAAVELVLDYNHIKLEDIRPKDLEEHEWLAATEADVDWNDPGTAVLNVPDVRHLFRAFNSVEL